MYYETAEGVWVLISRSSGQLGTLKSLHIQAGSRAIHLQHFFIIPTLFTIHSALQYFVCVFSCTTEEL